VFSLVLGNNTFSGRDSTHVPLIVEFGSRPVCTSDASSSVLKKGAEQIPWRVPLLLLEETARHCGRAMRDKKASERGVHISLFYLAQQATA
jgi:hypothetical protein